MTRDDVFDDRSGTTLVAGPSMHGLNPAWPGIRIDD
jgi:hypothetical protein